MYYFKRYSSIFEAHVGQVEVNSEGFKHPGENLKFADIKQLDTRVFPAAAMHEGSRKQDAALALRCFWFCLLF